MTELPPSGGSEGYEACDDVVGFASFQTVSSLGMVNSYSARLSVYLRYKNGEEDANMAEDQKNLCAMIPTELHSRVRAAQEQAGVTLSAYITELLTNYYEGVSEKMEKGMRTMAFQMPQEMFERLKKLLERESARTGKKVSQKEFVLGLIQRALDEAEQKEAGNGADLG